MPRLFIVLACIGVASGLKLPVRPAAAGVTQPGRREVLTAAASASLLGLARPVLAADELTTKSGVKYTVETAGNGGGKPVVGDLIAIRFKCSLQKTGQVIDDILGSPEPYYYRVGSGQVLPAVEEAVVMMRSGDKWNLTVPPTLGFGTKGRSASPGKPRVPGDAILDFTLELVAVPGKDEEMLEELGLRD